MSKLKISRVMIASIGYMLGGILIKGIAFITTPIFSRLLSPEEFGVLNTYLSYEAIIAMIIGFQFPSSFKAAKIEFQNVEKGIESYYSKIVMLLLVHSAVSIVAVNAFSHSLIENTGVHSVLLWNLLIINCFGNALVTVYNSYMALSYQYKRYLVIALLNAMLNVIISIALIMTSMSSDRSTGRILGYVLPYILISCYLVIVSFIKSSPKPFKKGEYSKFAYKYCAPLIPAGLSEVMLGQFGKLMVGRNCGYATMGIYSLSYNIYSIIGIVRIAMDYVVGPYFFEMRAQGHNERIIITTRMYSRGLALISTLVMLFSTELIRILGSVEYFEARRSAIPLVAASYFVFLCSTISQEEYYKKKTYLVSVASVGTMIINVLICLFVIPKAGAIGAAFCALFSYLIMMIGHCLIVKYKLKSDVFPLRSIIIDSVFVLAMVGVSLAVVDVLLPRYIMIIALIIALFIFGKKNYRKLIKE